MEAAGRTTGSKFGAIMTKIATVAKVAFAAVGVAAAGIFVAAIKKAAQFEQAMAMVKAVTGATAEEFDALSEEAKRLGLETAQTMTDIAAGMEALARAGFEVDEIIAAMAGVTALAESQLMDLGRAAQIVANVLKAMGLQASEADRIVNLFAATAASADVTVEDLAESFKYFAPVASQFNISVEESAAILGILGDNGLKGSMAATAFSTAMVRLADPTDEATDLMKKLNLEFWNAQGQFIGFTPMVALLEERMKNLTDQQKASTLATIFGVRAFKQIAPLIKGGAKLLRDYTAEITGTNAAYDQQAEMLDTVAGQWEILKGSIELLLVTLGGPMLDTIQQFLEDTLIPWVNYMTDASEGTSLFQTAIDKLIAPFQWMIAHGQAVKMAFLAIAAGLAAAVIYTHPLQALVIGLGLLIAHLVSITKEAPQTISSFKSMGEAIEYWLGVLEGADLTLILSFVKQYREALVGVLEEMTKLGDLSPEVLAKIRDEFALLIENLVDLPPEEMADAWIVGADMILSKWAETYPELEKLRLGYLGTVETSLDDEVDAHDEALDKITTGYEQMLVDILTGQIFMREQIQETAEELEPVVDLMTMFSDEYERLVEQGAPEQMIQSFVRMAAGFGIVLGKVEEVTSATETMRTKLKEAGLSIEKLFNSVATKISDAVNNNKKAQEDWATATADILAQYREDLAQLPIDHKAALDALDKRQADGLVTYDEYVKERKRLDDLYAGNRQGLHDEYRRQMDEEDRQLEEQKQTAADVLRSMAEDFLQFIRERALAEAAWHATEAIAKMILGPISWLTGTPAQHLAAAAVYGGIGATLALAGFQRGALFNRPTVLPPHVVAERGVSEAYLPLTSDVLGDIGLGIVDALRGAPQPALAGVGETTINVEISGSWAIREEADVELVSRALADEIDERLSAHGIGRF